MIEVEQDNIKTDCVETNRSRDSNHNINIVSYNILFGTPLLSLNSRYETSAVGVYIGSETTKSEATITESTKTESTKTESTKSDQPITDLARFSIESDQFKLLSYVFQSSDGTRVWLKSPNKIFSLCGNIYGDLWIGSTYGEIRWIFRNKPSSNSKYNMMGEPNILYLENGLFVFLLDNRVMYWTKEYRSLNSSVKKNHLQTEIYFSKYHVQIIPPKITEPAKPIGIFLTNAGKISIGHII